MQDLAAEIGVTPNTVGDIVSKRELPHRVVGRCKLLPPVTQRAVKKILNFKPSPQAHAASA